MTTPPIRSSLASLMLFSQVAGATIVPVAWDADGAFVHEAGVPPGKFVEVCEKFGPGAGVAWSFDARSPLDFNIHFHEGRDVRFPEKQAHVSRAEGVLKAAVEQDYCWMWTNKGAGATGLRLRLKKL